MVESMIYAGATPWHKLGRRISDSLTTEQAVVAAGLDWPVEVHPVYLRDGRPVTNARATVRASDGAILGAVGPGWRPLQNREAFRFFDPFLSAGTARLETAGSLVGGRKVWILARITAEPERVVGDDLILCYILLSNAHDGTLAVRAGFSPVRVVCWNTLTMAHNNAGSSLVRILHRANVAEAVERVGEVMDVVNREFRATAEQYRYLATVGVNADDLKKYVRRVFGVGEDAGKRLLGRVVPLFEGGKGQELAGARGTWWGAYNAVTDYLTHARGKTEDGRLHSLAYGQGAVLNVRALQVAVEMAGGATVN
jgi:phage/plasmid-like protein (TIGR03299 family)